MAAGGGASQPNGVMIMKDDSPVLERMILDATAEKREPQPTDQSIGDFDGTVYQLIVLESNLDEMTVAMRLPGYDVIKSFADEALAREMGDMWVGAIEGADAAVRFSLSAPPMAREALAAKVARMRRIAFGAPFDAAFLALSEKKKPMEALEIPYRATESVYLVPRSDRVVVIFPLCFPDQMDRAIARVVCQELSEAKRTVNRAPPASFTEPSAGVPSELRSRAVEPPENLVGYVSFAFLDTHVANAEQRYRNGTQLMLFRSFVQYHIKAAKAEMHSRMRGTVASLLEVMHQAYPDGGKSAEASAAAATKTGRALAKARKGGKSR